MEPKDTNLEEQLSEQELSMDLDSLLADVATLLTEPEDKSAPQSAEAAPAAPATEEPQVAAEEEPAQATAEEAPLQEPTQVLPTQESSAPAETIAFSLEKSEEAKADAPSEEPESKTAEDAALSMDTQVFPTPSAEALNEDATKEITAEFAPPAPPKPAPNARMRELRRKLVAGPEQRYYSLSEQGVGMLQIAIILNLVIVGICLSIAGMIFLEKIPESRLRLVIFSQVLALMVSGLLGCQLMLDSIGNLFKGKFTLDFLLTISFFACFVDGIYCLMELRIPCCAAFSLAMTMALWAQVQRRNTEIYQMDTLRKAVRLRGIVRTEDFYERKPGLLKKDGDVEDFMDVYQRLSGPEVLQAVYGIFALLCSIAIAVLGGMLHGASLGIQVFATSLLVSVPASFFVSYTRPAAILQRRLHMVGSVLCGWKGVKALNKKAYFPVDDADLFPVGSMKLNGVKFYGSIDPDTVVAYSASLVEMSGGGLLNMFRQLLTGRNGQVLEVENFESYSEGGIGGSISGSAVLLGSMQFLQDKGIHIPDGTMVHQAVYAAIDGELSAVYAISYAKMRSAAAGLVTLCGYRRLMPVVLSTDFMLTEEFLRSKFELKSKRILFPTAETKETLKKVRPIHDSPVLALTTRDELVSAAYAVTGARALHTAGKMGGIIHLIGGIAGLLCMAALAFLGSAELLTPANVLAYQLVWMFPGLLITEWTRTV